MAKIKPLPKAETGGAPKGSMATSTKKRYYDAGKGSRRRDPLAQDKYEENWEKIFGKKKDERSYTEYDDSEIEEQKARETWVCSICGKNTYDVDYEYIGSCTNHLGCELEVEMKSDKRVTNDRRSGDRREKNYSQKKHEERVFPGIDAIQKQIEDIKK
jgi:hypothetical protein